MAAMRITTNCSGQARKCLNLYKPFLYIASKRSFALSKSLLDNFDDETPGIHGFVNPKCQRNETVSQQRARLTYQSRKRGVSENGLLLSTFVAQNLDKLDQNLLNQYDDLINSPSNDWDLYYWMTGVKDTPTQFDTVLMDMLKKHVSNTNREKRFYQPALN